MYFTVVNIPSLERVDDNLFCGKTGQKRQVIVGDEKLDLDSYDAARVFFTRCDTPVSYYYFDSLPK